MGRKPSFEQGRLNTDKDDEQYDVSSKKVINLLNYTKTNDVSYAATEFPSGYHNFDLNGILIRGQRDPLARFKDLPFSLGGCSVLDLGCNQGGMLHAFAKDLKFGVGVDYDHKMINVANKIRSHNATANLHFYVFDLENENLDYLLDFLPENRVDLVFLLSVCKWINNWKEVMRFVHGISGKMIFESNGNAREQQAQITFLRSLYEKVQVISETSDDDPGQKNRKLMVCH